MQRVFFKPSLGVVIEATLKQLVHVKMLEVLEC